mmetsp:Transcript_4941/g.13970  ORF Transcript_4941/g.13970 Transcript_4941/m.13970 type:complete len:279 (+) Transcript_4941:789-1625(+)
MQALKQAQGVEHVEQGRAGAANEVRQREEVARVHVDDGGANGAERVGVALLRRGRAVVDLRLGARKDAPIALLLEVRDAAVRDREQQRRHLRARHFQVFRVQRRRPDAAVTAEERWPVAVEARRPRQQQGRRRRVAQLERALDALARGVRNVLVGPPAHRGAVRAANHAKGGVVQRVHRVDVQDRLRIRAGAAPPRVVLGLGLVVAGVSEVCRRLTLGDARLRRPRVAVLAAHSSIRGGGARVAVPDPSGGELLLEHREHRATHHGVEVIIHAGLLPR